MRVQALRRFAIDYAAHRQAEGRGYAGDALFALPYLKTGPLARQWAVRARSYEALMSRVIRPEIARAGRPLTVLDLGAGNGWLSYRIALEGCLTTALDIRDDAIDGLGAGRAFVERARGRMATRVAAFEEIPLPEASVDVAVFNASLHYATDLAAVLAEAARVTRPDGSLAILDSPFYRREADGRAMVAEKSAQATQHFGDRAETLTALPFIEFLTRQRLLDASAPLGLSWSRSRVLYPAWYELRPVLAAIKGARAPSRFDLWIGTRP